MGTEKRENQIEPSHAKVKEILDKHKSDLLSRPNVNGVGIGEETESEGGTRLFIQAYISKKVPPEELGPQEMLPKQLEGIEVRVRDIGELALENHSDADQSREDFT